MKWGIDNQGISVVEICFNMMDSPSIFSTSQVQWNLWSFVYLISGLNAMKISAWFFLESDEILFDIIVRYVKLVLLEPTNRECIT